MNSNSGKPEKVFTITPESVFTINQNRCSRCARISVHDRPEYAQLKRIGYCKNKPKELQALGISANSSNRDRKRIDEEFIAAGIRKESLKIKHKNRKTWPVEYYVHSMDGLQNHITEQGKKILNEV